MWKPGSDRPRPKTSKDAKDSKPAPSIGGSSLPPRGTASKPAKLSQKTLAMKFMQRKKQTDVERKAALQQQKQQDSWVENPTELEDDDSKLVCVADVPDPSLPLVFGRRSFGGFNKGVEDEYRDATRQLRYAASEEKELREEVSAEEMASRMVKYTGMGRGGNSQNQRNRKRQRK